MFLYLVDKYFEVRLLDHISVCLTLYATAKFFSREAVPLHIPAGDVWEPQVLHSLARAHTVSFLTCCSSGRVVEPVVKRGFP